MLDAMLLSWRLNRGAVIGWSLTVFAIAWLTAGFYPVIQDQYQDIFESLPEEFIDAFVGDVDPSTAEGYLKAEFLSYAPLLFAVFAVSQGSRALAGDEEDGTLDLILSQPVRRTSLALQRLAAPAVSVLALCAGASIGLILGAWMGDVDIAGWKLLLLGLDLWPLSFFILSLAFLGSAVFHRRSKAMLAATGYVVAAYFLNIFAPLAPELEPLQNISVFHYFQESDALSGSLGWEYWAICVGLGAVFSAAAIVWFDRKDIYN